MAEEQKPLTPCPECGAERLEADFKDSQSGMLMLKKPGKFLGGTGVRAVVCTGCGYTALYADQPLKLVVKRPDKALKKTIK